ncbi:CSLREA domain-containing protein [Deltaproteobacteria bacterium PRO3]|nr:CSLREA domain-containing protein [Deltaproteobacteria bacterium PRO3]
MAFHLSRLVTASSVAALLSLPLAAGAATITVTETADSFDNTGCSLREAIQEVNTLGAYATDCVVSGGFGSDDTLNLTATQPYVLSLDGPNEDGNATGDLDVFTSINIVGLGSGQTTITASGFTAGQTDRVLHFVELLGGVTPVTVNLQGLTVRDGNSTPSGSGGGIRADIPDLILNLTDVTVTENLSEEDAGGIDFNSDGGRLNLTSSSVSNNTVPDDAGGIDITSNAVAVLMDSTVDGNDGTDNGGGIRNSGGLLLINSTVSRNTVVFTEDGDNGDGGGIYNSGEMALINSTISGNLARVNGGGIYSVDGRALGGDLDNVQALLFNVTIADNTAEIGFGGGICNNCEIQPQGLVLEFRVANTLIAQNQAGIAMPDCGGQDPFVSGGYNLIGDATDCNGFTVTGDQTNVAAGIGALQNNGGPTETHALLTGSLAIDRGNDVEGCQGPVIADLLNGTLTLQTLTEDQRGFGFTRPVAILDPAVAICDIGAYELQVEEPTPSPTATPVPPPGPQLLEGSGISCSLGFGGSSAGAASLFLFGAVALVAAWRGVGLSRK